jgi:hypothetical protein
MGASRMLYQTFGWGDQGGVCVAISPVTGLSCASGAGNGVYSAALYEDMNLFPYIYNNASGPNYVHGIALTH